MSKITKRDSKIESKPEPKTEDRKSYGKSDLYFVEKFGMYRYEIYRIDQTGKAIQVTIENSWPTTAMDLIDLVKKDIDKGL